MKKTSKIVELDNYAPDANEIVQSQEAQGWELSQVVVVDGDLHGLFQKEVEG
jgi:hypothetical protein